MSYYSNPKFRMFSVTFKVNDKYSLTIPVHVRKEDNGDFIAKYRAIAPYGKSHEASLAVEMLVTKHLPKFIRAETSALVEKFIDQGRDMGPDELYETALKTVLARFQFDNTFALKVNKIESLSQEQESSDDPT